MGRDRELQQLTDVLDVLDGTDGGAGLCFVVGDAGIGKTRLAREVADVARARGHRVVWGLGWADSGSPPYWPWTQVVRQLVGLATGTDLASLVLPDHVATDRAELFDATAAVLQDAATAQPLVVVLDDLHLADPPTLALLGFVATHLRDLPLLVLATLRDRDAERRPELVEQLTVLDRLATTIPLTGLDVRAVGELIGSPRRARDLRAATGGNPLFLEQAARADLGATDTLVSVLRSRVSHLGPEVARTLAAAAVLGPGVAVDDLAVVRDRPAAVVTDHLRAASTDGLFDQSATRLSHPLLADAALASLTDDERHALHAAAADRLDAASPADRAHHLCHAGPDRWRDAVAACVDAADEATAVHAHEDAVGHLTRAVTLADEHGADDAELVALNLALAGAVIEAAGRAEAEPHYLRAWELAQRTDDPLLLARAAARHGPQYFFAGDVIGTTAANARDALARYGDGTTALHARLHATLAAATLITEPAAAREHATRAVTIARTDGDPRALAAALVAEQVTDLGPATLLHRLDTAREIIALAESARAPDLAVHGRFLLLGALLERGEIGELDAQLRRQDALIDEFASPRFARHALWFQCTRAMLDGDPDRVESLAGECFAIADRLDDPDGIAIFGAQYGVAQWMRGRIDTMEQAYLDSMRADPENPVWRAVLAWLWADQGRRDEARGALAHLPPAADLASGQFTLLTMTTAADAAVAVADDERVDDLWEALLPYAERVVPIAMGAACWGTVASRLGALALHRGRTAEGIAHLEQAIAVCARLGARPWLADAQLALAAALLDHDRDPDRAAQLVHEAAAAVDQLDLGVLRERADALRLRISDAPPAAATAPAPVDEGEPRPRISVLGTFEVTAVDGTIPRWTSRKARQLLKILVARRGVATSRDQLMHLLWPDEDPAVLANRLSVALSTVRRSLDPARSAPANHFVAAEAGALRLVRRNVDIDLERFLAAADTAVAAHRAGRPDARAQLRAAHALHGGEPLPDEPYADWAEPLRIEVATSLSGLLRCDVEAAVDAGDDVGAAAAHRRLLELDPYDESAHRGLIGSLRRLGAHGQAEAAHRRYVAAMDELGVPVSDD